MLTAAVFEGNYNVVFKAFVLLENLEIQMGISAVADTLANLETKRSGHHFITLFTGNCEVETLFSNEVIIVQNKTFQVLFLLSKHDRQ